MPPRIKPLDKNVVNRIAAGEIIIAPSNALKEIVENSIDAHSSAIEISVKDGGVKLLQITDDGGGINKEDLPLLCERFTTSKLRKFEDLETISTYGFRGEALASISHISHLSVVTKTAADQCAWKCYYLDGKLVPPPTGGSSEPRPIAGKCGTSIIVEDLFYNVPSRLRTLRSYGEEYAKIVEIVSRYAIHTENVGFSCKKQGSSSTDLVIRAGMSRKDRIRSIFGSSVANELIDVELEPNSDIGLVKCSAYVTNSNYSNRKSIKPIFFINNRLVVCEPLRRAMNQVYSTYLPKGHKPFIYLALEIVPGNVDVNVHPTKREVRFLNEEEIVQSIVDAVEGKLSSLDSSRTFLTQQVITQSQRVEERLKRQPLDEESDTTHKRRSTASISSIKQFKRPYEKDMVRTDFSQATLEEYVSSQAVVGASEEVPRSNHVIDSSIEGRVIENHDDADADDVISDHVTLSDNEVTNSSNTSSLPAVVKLSSVNELRKEVESQLNVELTALFSKHTFIGVADYSRRLLCLQYGVKLFLVDYASVCNEFFYQVGLSDFGNFGRIRFSKPVDIRMLVKEEIYEDEQLMKRYPGAPDLDGLIQSVYVEMAEMLEEYFCMKVDVSDAENPKLLTIPMLVKGYIPSFNKLSLFLFKVGACVDWEDEKQCLGGILRQLALFYVPEPLSDLEDDAESRRSTSEQLENILFPLIKKRFLATENLVRDVVEIANLPGLYKVFERC
ncbi:hypothetical protein FOA43_003242 [Brettanomyces nanus]|uniref:DNA mismatch repair protein S5 domain-containing protein n=1 Tax=Eeniella nana TaxID=13502 RepID=A0A875S4I1_EENNA|nr:uncharacterized protein FOA43_003242 [Brettanomyces nanus]QPG75858.1 hypothetical protein FOA43_003242 [Brettanomyces nanus]